MPRILGLDYGSRRLGFALSDPDGVVATPLRVVPCRSDAHAVNEIVKVCAEMQASKLVVGLPLQMDGTKGIQAERVLAVVKALSERLGIPVVTWDERLTTRSAENVLIEADTSRRRRKEVVDKLAAAIMLQGYLDAQALPPPPGPGP